MRPMLYSEKKIEFQLPFAFGNSLYMNSKTVTATLVEIVF